MGTEMKEKKRIGLKQIVLVSIVVYACIAVLFYYAAGYQLHFRSSRGNTEIPAAETGTVELVAGATVEQTFTVDIQRLEKINVQWGTFFRENFGTATMELYSLNTQTLLMSQTFDVHAIADGGITTMSAAEPLEGLSGVPLMLRIYADSGVGQAAFPLMSWSAAEKSGNDGFSLLLNGQSADAVLCFSATGEDYTWIGSKYWPCVVLGGALLLLCFAVAYYRWKNGKRSLAVTFINTAQKYRFLVRQLVSRDFKSKYKRSILGVLWSLLNPLLNMTVQYVVFSNMFRFDIPHFPVYLLCGNVVFSYFSEACGMALNSIVGNAGLITKVYVPKYIYPLTRILSSLINMLLAMIPLFAAALLSGLFPTKAYLLLPFPLICLALFCLGLGMCLASAMVFFRDIQFLWGILTTVWMYLTPIFYPITVLPDSLQMLVRMNPLYVFITFIRSCVVDGISPDPVVYGQCLLIALAALVAGAAVFKKTQDHFVLYL